MKPIFNTTTIALNKKTVTSLCWHGDNLIDWVSGGACWSLAGAFQESRRGWGYERFNAAVTDETGRWAVVYERTGTCGIVLRDGEIVREIHRPPYHADVFEYPVCFFHHRSKVLLAHCPEHYGSIEIDDAETGERLTRSAARKPADFFHSRLTVSPEGQRLCSAGWFWQPSDAVVWFDIDAALSNPTTLDELQGAQLSRTPFFADESSACWLSDNELLLGGGSEAESGAATKLADESQGEHRLRPNSLALFDLRARAYTCSIALPHPPGMMMPVGAKHVVTFFKYPKLFSLETQSLVCEWPSIRSGEITSSLITDCPYPNIALDSRGSRFAVADSEGIHVVTLNAAALAR